MSAILGTYNRKKISFKKGKGAYLYAHNGKKYLDFVSGIAVNSLGHCHSHMVRAIQKQSKKLIISLSFIFKVLPKSFDSETLSGVSFKSFTS